jgi:hypothetical protein
MRKSGGICLIGALLLAVAPLPASSQNQQSELKVSANEDSAGLKETLERVGARVRNFQEDLFNVKWTVVHRGQQLKADLTPKGKPLESVVDWIIVRRTAKGDPQKTYAVAVTEAKLVEGKPPREKKPHLPPEDPKFAYRHPLYFLSPDKQAEWVFGWEGETDLKGQKAVMITAAPAQVTKPITRIEKRKYYVEGLQRKARVWIDAQTYDVLQVEWRLLDTVNFKTKFGLSWHGPFFVTRPAREIEFEKMDQTIRFDRVAFKNPDQTLLLPVSEEHLHVIRGARNPAYRSTVSYVDYKRFVTDLKVKTPDQN